MEIIREKDINFKALTRIHSKTNSESRLFHDGEVLYKMYKETPLRLLNRKKHKIELLNGEDRLDNVIFPDKIILKKQVMSGCCMPYIDNATIMFYFATQSSDINVFLQLVSQISHSLRKIHNDPRNIVVGDLSFSNIIFDENMNHYFIDFDSCMIDKIPSDMISFLFDYYLNERGINYADINQNTDKLCLILNTIYTIFCKDVDSLSMYEFDSKAEKVSALKNMREIVLEIKKYGNIPTATYIDEFIPETHKKRVRVTSRS